MLARLVGAGDQSDGSLDVQASPPHSGARIVTDPGARSRPWKTLVCRSTGQLAASTSAHTSRRAANPTIRMPARSGTARDRNVGSSPADGLSSGSPSVCRARLACAAATNTSRGPAAMESGTSKPAVRRSTLGTPSWRSRPCMSSASAWLPPRATWTSPRSPTPGSCAEGRPPISCFLLGGRFTRWRVTLARLASRRARVIDVFRSGPATRPAPGSTRRGAACAT